jgi:hypothetical protein
VLVLADQVGGRIGEQVEEALQIGPGQRGLEILDDVELDAALAQDVQRAARLASAGVVIDGDLRHGRSIASAPWRV